MLCWYIQNLQHIVGRINIQYYLFLLLQTSSATWKQQHYTSGIINLMSVTDAVQVCMLSLGSVLCSSSSSCCGDQQQHGGAMRMDGRRLLLGHQVLAKGLMEHAKKQEALLDEQKREVITGPNPLHNR
ncbi:hypothetical protein ABZP36_006035 [Zizania latifolia]